ncbi:hypothetical protein F4553_008061 [Allocatelliglobosispora scoriae]|uniref:Uncharacterized protein n=1 Tax=Allocatelliglobosispora scoriae TaxID=643052 RepID=A0A841BZN3_9ACTN|nr:hypothetical protein [Allocatelliglobosispora scoriae]MBB5874627.1 hypothetical protein [Allocatelliglobosispora scoriae]
MIFDKRIITTLTAPLEVVTKGRDAERGLSGRILGLNETDNEFLSTWGLPRTEMFHPFPPNEVVTDDMDYFTHFGNFGPADEPTTRAQAFNDGMILSRTFDQPVRYKIVNSSMMQFGTTMWRWVSLSEILIEMSEMDEDYFPGLALFWQHCRSVDTRIDLNPVLSYWQARVHNL